MRQRIGVVITGGAAWLVPVAAAVAVMLIGATPASSAQKTGQFDQAEQYRYAVETLNLDYSSFAARRDDFLKSGCVGWKDGRLVAGCTKPAPYNMFDWSTDGCSVLPAIILAPAVIIAAKQLFNRACQLHDFGYRNFGKGPTLGRTEGQRRLIDNRFLEEMNRICDNPFLAAALGTPVSCRAIAAGFYTGVRNLSDWSENPADLTGDGKVDIYDLSLLLSNYGKPGRGDLNGNGVVDLADLSILLSNYGY